jgi:3'(2'), 5'-bisphosphate nucleotidase
MTASRLVEIQDGSYSSSRNGSWLEDRGDAEAHEYLVGELGRERPEDGLLSEEGLDDGARVECSRSWIVDPLDGSSGFGAGNAEWAVHVALAVDGEPSVGAVAVPGMGLTASTSDVPVLPHRGERRPIIVTGRSRSWSDGRYLADVLDADLAACSSAGVKAMLVATGEADIYVHDAPLYEWDVCAPVAVALAAGLDACAADGTRLGFNKPRPVVPSLVICRREFTTDVVSALQARLQ